MGRKGVVRSFAMLDAADASTDQTSPIVDVINQDQASIRVSWTGSPVGELFVQVRNGDLQPWYDLDMGAPIAIDGTETNHQLVFNQMPFTGLRVFYDRTSGTGTITAVISSKVIGA